MDLDWLEADAARLLLVPAVVGLAIVAVVALRLVRKTGKWLILAGLAVVLAVVLAGQWASLSDCRQTCACTLFGQELAVPDNALCGEDRLRVDVDVGTVTG